MLLYVAEDNERGQQQLCKWPELIWIHFTLSWVTIWEWLCSVVIIVFDPNLHWIKWIFPLKKHAQAHAARLTCISFEHNRTSFRVCMELIRLQCCNPTSFNSVRGFLWCPKTNKHNVKPCRGKPWWALTRALHQLPKAGLPHWLPPGNFPVASKWDIFCCLDTSP